MADEKKTEMDSDEHLSGPPSWEELPWEARRFVYEHLRKEASAARARFAEARLSAMLATSGLAKDVSHAEHMALTIETAFEAALFELEAIDPFTCETCGEMHEPQAPHPSLKEMS